MNYVFSLSILFYLELVVYLFNVVLKAHIDYISVNKVSDLIIQVSIDKRFDELKLENKCVVKQLQDQIGKVRDEFNSRIEGLTKNVETKVTQNVKKAIDDKVKGVKKEMESELTRVKNNMKETEKDITRVKETIIPTMDERIGDELEEIHNKVEVMEKDMRKRNREGPSNKQKDDGNARSKNIILRNFPERADEDIKRRVHYMIRDTMKLNNICVVSAERLTNNNSSKPGIVKVTLDSKESKQRVMQHKKKLKDSSRYNKTFIEHDILAAQRAINANFRTVLNVIGERNLQLRGSRISARQVYQEKEDKPFKDYSRNTGSYNMHETKNRAYRRQESPSRYYRNRDSRQETRYNY